MREEGAGDVADAFGVEEIELHEAFDRALAGAVGEFHPARDLALEIEGQPVLGAPREDVEMAAHREQEIFGALELAQLARRHQPSVDELGHGAHAVDELADPDERVQVGQDRKSTRLNSSHSSAHHMPAYSVKKKNKKNT